MDGKRAYVFDLVIPYLSDPRDRDTVSRVCKDWYLIDKTTCKHVSVALCYIATPELLSRRFCNLQSLKVKGKPRAAGLVGVIPKNWGASVTPWVEEINRFFPQMKSLHFKRMIVRDSDLELLANYRGEVLEVLVIHKCSGFSTDGLLHIARSCRVDEFGGTK